MSNLTPGLVPDLNAIVQALLDRERAWMDQLHFSFHIRQGGVELCYGGVRQLWVEWDAANELVMDLLDAEVRDEAYSYGDESNKYVDEVVAWELLKRDREKYLLFNRRDDGDADIIIGDEKVGTIFHDDVEYECEPGDHHLTDWHISLPGHQFPESYSSYVLARDAVISRWTQE